jgi:hypothetical protein
MNQSKEGRETTEGREATNLDGSLSETPSSSAAATTASLQPVTTHVVMPEAIPAPLAASINAMLRTLPVPPSARADNGISLSLTSEPPRRAAGLPFSGAATQLESDRTAELRAKGASLVQRLMTDKGRTSGTPRSNVAVTSAASIESNNVPASAVENETLLPQNPIVAPEYISSHGVDSVVSAEETLQYAESTLDRLIKEERSSVLETGSQALPVKTTQPASVVGKDPKDASSHEGALDIDGLYVALAGGRNRWDATLRMVEWLAKALPGAHVRCGLGASRLKRFVDARLGWLGSESSLQRAMAGQWRAQLLDSAESTYHDGKATIRLNNPGFNQIALLSIEGDRVTDAVFQVLKAHEKAIAAILWGRPSLALPEWSAIKGRPRLAIIAAGVMLALLFVCPVPYPAVCTVIVEPVGSRVVSAPFEATLESVSIEPGNEVTKGQLLASLDGRPLRLEQQSIDAEIQQATKQQDVALAAGRIAEGQLAQLKVQQLRRQRDLLERRLNQLSITSPIDGVVVAGDLRRSIGVPLESGQMLFEIAPLDRVLLEVEIPEREIGLVNEDSPVQLRVESARTGNVEATLSKIYPMAQLREEKSVFIAPIEIDNSSRQYRPGMRGRATVFGPVRPWAWRHIRGVVEQVAWLARW